VAFTITKGMKLVTVLTNHNFNPRK